MLNVAFAIILYGLVWVLYKYSNSVEETGFIRRVARFLYSSYLRSVCILLTLWVYIIVSLALWIGWTESFVQVMLVGMGFVGGLSIIVELKLLKRPSMVSAGPDFYISTVEYYYEKKSVEETKEPILGLIIESETDDDAKQALEALLSRDDNLGETTRRFYTEYRRKGN